MEEPETTEDPYTSCEEYGHNWEEGWVPPICLDCGFQDEM